jgi:hypothetical protein
VNLDQALNALKAYLQEHGCKYLNAGCFAAGTKLWTPSGYRSIEELQVGDWVCSRDEYQPGGLIEAKQVEEVFVRFAGILHLHVGGQLIRTTGEHPFYAYNKGWTAAKDLSESDWILTGRRRLEAH